jgi:cytochrome P450
MALLNLENLSTLAGSLSLLDVAIWLATGSAVWVGLIIVYRLTLHPLAGYPGNFLEQISDLPLIAYCIGGTRHLRILDAHEKYGSVIRIGPNTLSFNTVTALEAIHVNRRANVKRAEWYKTIDAGSGDYSTQSCMDKKEHAFRRRVLAHAFSEKALRDAESFIDTNAKTLVKCIGEDMQEDGWTSVKDFSVWTTYYGFDVAGDLAFGSSFNMMENDEYRYLPTMLMGTSWFIYWAGYLPCAWILRILLVSPIMNYFPGQAARDSYRFFQMAQSRLSARFELEKDAEAKGEKLRPDIFHYIMKGRDPETGLGFSRDQLNADAGLLVAAGSDGVGIVLSATLFYLLRNPEILEKLTQDVRSSFDSMDDMRGLKINQVPYLHAVIEETLRITPPIPSPLPREVEKGGIDIDGRHIPEGIDVGVPQYAIHHNENYYPDSWAFQPERWLADKESVALAKRAFCAFSRGGMDCIGQRVAYLACKLALAKLLYVYDVRPAGEVVTGGETRRPRPEEYQMIDWVVGYRSGPHVQFKVHPRS